MHPRRHLHAAGCPRYGAPGDELPPPVGPAMPATPISHRLPQRPPQQRRSPARPAGTPQPAPGRRIDEYAIGR